MSLFEKRIAKVTRRPKLLLGCLAVLLLALLGRVVDLTFDSDVNRVFLTNSPLSQAQRAFSERFRNTGSDVAFLIEADAGLSTEQIEAARDLALDLELHPRVTSVASPFSLRFPPDHPSMPEAPVIPVEIDMEVLWKRLAEFEALEIGFETGIRSDALILLATVDLGQGAGDTIAALDTLATPVREKGATVTITGPDVVESTMRAALARDLLMLNLIGIGLASLVAVLCLGSARLALLAVLPALPGMVATVGLAAWLGFPITVLSNVIPMLMLVIGIANGMHLSVSLARTTGPLPSRIADTLTAVGPASLLTAITTAVAFIAILVSPNAQLREFGILGASAALVSIGLLLPSFLAVAVLLAPDPRPAGTAMSRIASRLGAWAASREKSVGVAGLVIFLVAATGFWTTTAWFPYSSYLPAGSDLAPANDRIARDFGGVYRTWVEMPADATWEDLRAAVDAVEAVAGRQSVLSEVAFARWQGGVDSALSPDDLGRLPADLRARLRDPVDGTLRFAIAMPEPMQSDASLGRYDAIESAALAAGAAQVIGLPAVMRHGSVDLVRQLSTGLLIASAAGAAIVALASRRLSLLPLLFVVNLLPVLLIGALPHVIFDGRLTPPVALALTIAFGIAIDDTIHMLNRYLRAHERHGDRSLALRTALEEAGGVMAMTTLLLTGGLIVTVFSIFAPVGHFGLALIASLWAALLTDLIVLPALLMIGGRHERAS